MKHSPQGKQQPATDLAHHPRQRDSDAEAAKLPAASSARQSGADSATPSGLHDSSASQQAQQQQQAAPVGQTDSLPVGNGLDRLRLEGRFSVDRRHGQLTFEWPLSTIRARFEGTSLAVKLRLLKGGPDYYAVRLDGGEPRVLQLSRWQKSVQLFEDLPPGPHEVSITKRTEPSAATACFLGFELAPGGQLLEAPAARTRQLEIIGDSISAGYGNECRSEHERYTPLTQNACMSYGAIAGRDLGAEVRIVAWSGKGLYRNSDHATEDTVPQLWNRTLPSLRPEEKWKFAAWAPDVVVVNLMTNDYAPPPPESALLREAWLAFLTRIRRIYPSAAILLTLGPMMNDDYPPEYPGCLSAAREVLERVLLETEVENVSMLEFPEEHTLGLPLGCSGHPSVAIHQVMAEHLTAAIRNTTGW